MLTFSDISFSFIKVCRIFDTNKIEIELEKLKRRLKFAMEEWALKKCKQLFEYQHLLLFRDIWWSKF